MEKKPSLAKGFQRGVVNVDTKVEWDSIALTLNSLGPPSRDGKEWQKVWSDIKFKVKKKLLHNKKEYEATGGGTVKLKYLSDLEEVISNLLSFEKMISPKGKVLGGAQIDLTPKSSTSKKNPSASTSTSASYIHPFTSTSASLIHPSTSTSASFFHPSTSTSASFIHPSTSTSASFIHPSTPNSATSSSNLAPSRIIDNNDEFSDVYTDFYYDHDQPPEIQNTQFITEIEQQPEVPTQEIDQNRRKLPKLNDKNSLLQKQTDVQEKLYEEVKEYLKRIDNHLKESAIYERKRFYLEEEKLKLYKMQLEREEKRAMHLESSKENKP